MAGLETLTSECTPLPCVPSMAECGGTKMVEAHFRLAGCCQSLRSTLLGTKRGTFFQSGKSPLPISISGETVGRVSESSWVFRQTAPLDAGRAVEDVDGRAFGCPSFQVISAQALDASINTTGFGTTVVPLTE
jgi:hypothetical protein